MFLFLLARTGLEAVAESKKGFLIEENPRLELPARGSAVLSIYVTSGDGTTISNASIRVRQLKFPNGNLHEHPEAIVKATSSPFEATADGRAVMFEIDEAQLTQPGDYKVTIVFAPPAGDTTHGSTFTTAILHRAGIELNLDELKDQVIPIKRWTPWCPASGGGAVLVRETSGKGALSTLAATGDEILEEKTREQSGARLATAWDAAVTGDRIRRLRLHVKDVSETGLFSTRVIFSSPALSADKILPLKVAVSDAFLCPLLVIVFGVLGGFGVRYLAEVWRPRKENEVLLIRLRAEIERSLRLIELPAKGERLRALRGKLLEAEEANSAGRAPAAKTLLDDVNAGLATFEKEEATQKAEVREALAKWNEAVSLFDLEIKREADPTTAERQLVAERPQSSDKIDTALAINAVDAAKRELAILDRKLTDLRNDRTRRALDALESELTNLPNSADEKKPAWDAMRAARSDLLNGNWDAARGRLPTIKSEIEILQQQVPKASGARGSQLRPVPLVEAIQIVVNTPAASRLAHSEIHFAITGAPGVVQQTRWTFGGDGSTTTQTGETAHLFEEAGEYLVSAEIKVEGKEDALRVEPVSLRVLPSRDDREIAGARRQLARSEWLMTGLALIVAPATGMLALYAGKNFGTLADYLTAFLWGFAIDTGVRGFAQTFRRFDRPSAS